MSGSGWETQTLDPGRPPTRRRPRRVRAVPSAGGSSISEEVGPRPERRAVRRIADPRYDWVGIYRLKEDTLVLHSYVGGPTEHAEIPVGVGVCGERIFGQIDLDSDRADAFTAEDERTLRRIADWLANLFV